MTGPMSVCPSCRFPATHCECGGLALAPQSNPLAIRQLRDLLLQCLGEVPSHLNHRFANPLQQGRSNSGVPQVISGSTPTVVLDLTDGQMVKQGDNGLASVHVSVAVGAPIDNGVNVPNNVLVLQTYWQSGNAGGTTLIDATRGGMHVVGGDNVVRVEAYMASSIEGDPLVVYAPVTVQANVHWDGSVNAQAAQYTSQFVALNETGDGIVSAWIPLPNQAKSMIAIGPDPALFEDLTAEFATADTVASIKYRTLNPNANGSPICAGVNFVRFTHATTATSVAAAFEYYI